MKQITKKEFIKDITSKKIIPFVLGSYRKHDEYIEMINNYNIENINDDKKANLTRTATNNNLDIIFTNKDNERSYLRYAGEDNKTYKHGDFYILEKTYQYGNEINFNTCVYYLY